MKNDTDTETINAAFKDLMQHDYPSLYINAYSGSVTARAFHDDITLLKLVVLALHKKIKEPESIKHTMAQHKHFDAPAFASVIKEIQTSEDITTRQLATEACIGAANLTRLFNEHSCGIDTFCALCRWANLDANGFIR